MNAIGDFSMEDIKRPTTQMVISCSECGEMIPLDTPEHAIAVNVSTVIEIYKWADRAKMHLVEITRGEVLLCLFSIDR